MQHPATHFQPQSLPPAVRIGLAAAVALLLTGVLAVATSASHTAVRHASAQMQDTTRYVKLPPVEIVGRRAVAMDSQDDAPQARAAAASTSTPACVQPT
ncbi:hypothetical protein ACPWT1_15920 [Ramlibacter sp. MMS24-I3-19]|uniref:hypothetical protein n=1 Tax=Ramlibacter sp. MMS24-I3-19 TaxID=3416606 RepID=UPI003D068A88